MINTPTPDDARKEAPKFDKALTAYNSLSRAWIGTHFGGRDYCSDGADFGDAVNRLESDLLNAYEQGQADVIRQLSQSASNLMTAAQIKNPEEASTENLQSHNNACVAILAALNAKEGG